MPVLLREFYSLCPNGICDIGLLTEDEKRMRNDGYTILTGILQSADKKNGNGRVYRRKILEREMENYQKAIRERRSTGELDHSNESIINLKNASHLILRTWWDGNDVMGVIKVLKSTPSGQTLEGLMKDGVQVGISSRGLGSLSETNNGLVVEDDFQLICFDIVENPSNFGSFMHVNESKIKEYFTKADRINRLLNEILSKD